MNYEQVLAHFGTQVAIGDALGIQQSTVSLWGRVVPDKYQYQLEIITNGALTVDDHLRHPRRPSLVGAAEGIPGTPQVVG